MTEAWLLEECPPGARPEFREQLNPKPVRKPSKRERRNRAAQMALLMGEGEIDG